MAPESLDGGLTAVRCAACAAVHFPACAVCPECGGTMGAVPLGRSGRVETWTTVHRAPAADETPYVLCWVWLDEGLRVLARWETDGAPPSSGLPVELVPRRDGRLIASPTRDVARVS